MDLFCSKLLATILVMVAMNACASITGYPEPDCKHSAHPSTRVHLLDAPQGKSLGLIDKNASMQKLSISPDEKWIQVKYKDLSGWVSVLFVSCRYDSKVTKSLVSKSAEQVMALIKDNNWGALAELAHPVKGVRFSPYAGVDTSSDQVFLAGDFAKLKTNKDTKIWGYYDGSGDPISLSFVDYVEKFIRQHPFWSSNNILYNEVEHEGNTPSNLEEVYPHAVYIDYSLSGLDSAKHGTDWSSLRLVFEKYQGKWVLLGIVSAGWTI